MSALVENMDEGLTPSEAQQLEDYEAIIARSLRGFVEVGEALAEIRDRRLYRAKFSSFEAYLAEKWPGVKRRQAYRLIEGAAIASDVSHGSHLPAPETERQARALAVVPEQERPAVWEEAVERNGGKPAPARVVEEVWQERNRPAPPADEDPPSREEYYAPILKPSTPVPASSPVAPVAPSESEESKGSRDGDEWYTRENHAASVRKVLGRIDLDPASCAAANEVIGAREYFGLDNGHDGLAEVWCAGRLYLNPPYSDAGAWVGKLSEAYRTGLVGKAIALVNANTSSSWFENLWEQATALCWVKGRVSFIAGDGGKSATGWSPSVFAYFGDDPEAFRDEFKQYGRVQPLWLMRQWEEGEVK